MGGKGSRQERVGGGATGPGLLLLLYRRTQGAGGPRGPAHVAILGCPGQQYPEPMCLSLSKEGTCAGDQWHRSWGAGEAGRTRGRQGVLSGLDRTSHSQLSSYPSQTGGPGCAACPRGHGWARGSRPWRARRSGLSWGSGRAPPRPGEHAPTHLLPTDPPSRLPQRAHPSLRFPPTRRTHLLARHPPPRREHHSSLS